MTSNQDSNVPPATKRDKNDKEAIRDSTVRLIKTLTTATESMPPLPKNSFVTITLQYRDDTPQDYEVGSLHWNSLASSTYLIASSC